MLNPRVFNFKPPPLNVSYKRGNINEDLEKINRTIENHFFNFSVSLVLPDTMSVPQHLVETLTVDADYYKLTAVPLHLLISQDFIDYFIKGGEVTALSTNTYLDCDNSAVITPCGHLVLNIDSKTFQQLGLVKGPAINIRKNKNSTYAIFIYLKTDCFKIGRNNYEKAYLNLLQQSNLKFDFIITWEPLDSKVCPSSLAKYFVRHDIEVSECQLEDAKRIIYSVKFPLLRADDEDLIEWFGALAFDAVGSDLDENREFMFFEPPEPFEDIGQVVFASWTGLLSRKRILSFFKEIRQLAAEAKDIPWIGFSVLGYLDSPVSWGLQPHNFRISGENDYTILINHEGSFVMCKNTETCSAR